MKIRKKGCTMKQMAYARRLLGAQGMSKKEIALDVGYSPYVANAISSHIENKPGFNNAMAALAIDSNNLALAAMHEFKARGFETFTNKELVGALNAIGSAWSRFNATPRDSRPPSENSNRLRTVIMQRIENQTNVSSAVTPPSPVYTAAAEPAEEGLIVEEKKGSDDVLDLDF